MESPKGESAALPPGGGAADSHAGWTKHGPAVFEDDTSAELTPAEQVHSWTFELDGPARVTFETLPRGDGDVDTVLHLLNVTVGVDRVATNDDGGERFFSQIHEELTAGLYEVLVTGYDTTDHGAFALRGKCRGDGCTPSAAPVESCSGLDIATGLNPCADGQYCQVEAPTGFDGTCQPARALYGAALAEYDESFGGDPALRFEADPIARVVGTFASDGDGNASIGYYVELFVQGRQVRFYFQANGVRDRAVLGNLFHIVPPAQMLEVGTPTIFVGAPAGETLERFNREIETAPLENLTYPLQALTHGDGLVVVGALPLYEEEALAELQERFPDHSIEYNTVRLATTGSSTEAPIATFTAE